MIEILEQAKAWCRACNQRLEEVSVGKSRAGTDSNPRGLAP